MAGLYHIKQVGDKANFSSVFFVLFSNVYSFKLVPKGLCMLIRIKQLIHKISFFVNLDRSAGADPAFK